MYFRMVSVALDVRSFSRLFKALGDETRLRIVALLAHGELCVCHLEDALRISQPKVSRHLAILRAAGVVDHRREGTWVYYRLAPQAEAWQGSLQRRDVLPYLGAQFGGAVAGVAIANVMFGEPVFAWSLHARHGSGQFLSEFIATFGLLVVISSCARRQPTVVHFAVASYIMSAYWFTASTSFANPAVTFARSLTNTFTGIRPMDVLPFVAAQVLGAAAAMWVRRWLVPRVGATP
jgi:DNA-binding transcriptional ArsR family regulator